MNAALVLDNLLAWSAQVALLVAVAGLAAITLTHPRARLIFWQGILAISLLLPAVEPWRQPMGVDPASVSIATGTAQVVITRPAGFHFAWKREYFLLLIATGAVLRFLWIAAGLMRLRRHRLDARMLTIPPVPFSNPRVRWFVSNTVGGPVTFGFLNPSILLPARVVELDADLREAIAHHELAHVRRRDWLFVLLEESIRGLLWFHPAIWFVLSRIQLAREQVVDAEVVGLTRDRERYLDALVAVAAQRLMPDVAPAPLFLKKRQLAVRVAAVLKETRMSKPRTFFSFATVCSAAFIAVRLSVWMFPLEAPAQTRTTEKASIVADGPGVVVEPGAKVLHRPPVFYPRGGTTTGSVIVEATVSAKGEVTDARVIGGPEEFRSAALSSVLNWHFSAEGGLPPTIQSTIRFTAPAKTAAAPPPPATHSTDLTLKKILTDGLPADLEEKVRASIPMHIGDPFSADAFNRTKAAVQELDEHLVVAMVNISATDAMLVVSLPPLPMGGMRTQSSGADVVGAPQRIRVGGNVQSSNLIKKVTPLYPPDAKAARIQGTVRFTATIGKDGSIINLEVVSGHPLLVESAQEAVKQWMYKPTLLNGNPVEVITQIDVNYTLSQ